jgi:hypothetical protein
LGLSILHVGHGLLHGLKHLILHHQNLLQGRWWVGSIVVFSIIVLGIGIAVPCVDIERIDKISKKGGWGREIMVDKEIPN